MLHFITLFRHKLRLSIINFLKLLLLHRHPVINSNLLSLHFLLVLSKLFCFQIKLSCKSFLVGMQVFVFTFKLFVSTHDILDFTELIWVSFFYFFKKLFKPFHCFDLFVNSCWFLVINSFKFFLFINFLFKLLNLFNLSFTAFRILFPSHFLLLQKRWELDQVVLNHDILFSKLILLDLESFFLLQVLFLLVFKSFLHFIHKSSLFKQSGSWWHWVKLKVLW